MKGPPLARSFVGTPLGITLSYVIITLCWLLFSDQLLTSLTSSTGQMAALQTFKGGFYTILAASLLYLLLQKNRQSPQEKTTASHRQAALVESALEAIPDIFYVFDSDGKVLIKNSRVEEVSGYTSEEIAQMHPLDFTSDKERVAEAVKTILEEHRTVTVEAHFLTKSGEEIPYEFTGTPLKDQDGNIIGIAGSGHDISRQKEREEALEREKERFQLLVNEVKDYAIFTLDPSGHIQSWNKGANQIKGYTEEEILGKHLSTFYTQEDQEEGLPCRMLEEAAEKGRVQDEGWRVRKDGSRFWALVSLTALYDEEGTLRGYAKVTRDMTEERERKRRFQAIFNQTYQLTALLQADGTVIEANETALTFGGFSRADVIGQPLWKTLWFTHSKEVRAQTKADVRRAASGAFVRHELEIQGKSGTAIIDFSLKPIRDDDGEIDLLIFEGRDITDQKQLEEENEKIARREREWFAQELHDGVCQQLTNLSIMTAMLRKRLETGAEDSVAKALERLEQMSSLTDRAVKEVRALSHGMAPVDFSEEDFIKIMEELISGTGAAHRVSCTFEVEEGTEVSNPTVATNLYRITQEALSNGIRHGKADHIKVTLKENEGKIILRIEDDGKGIEEQAKGGIGLENMRRRAQVIGGTLEVNSSPQNGTAVTCVVPTEGRTSQEAGKIQNLPG